MNLHVVRAHSLKAFADDAMGEFGPIAVAAEVAEIQVPQFSGHNLFGGVGSTIVGKMAVPAQDALFETPRTARVIVQHFHIVIGFEQENIGGADAFYDEFGGVTEVRKKTNVARRSAQQKSNGIGGIVWHGERVHGDIADLEARTGAEHTTFKSHLKLELDGLLGEPVAVDRDIQFCPEAGKSLDVIGMFVGDQDAGQTFRRAADAGEALANLAATESGVDEDAGIRCFQVGTVTAGTAAENRQVNSHDATLVRLA